MFIKKLLRVLGVIAITGSAVLVTAEMSHMTQHASDVLKPVTKPVENKLYLKAILDDKFTSQNKDSITAGLREWTRATNNMITFDVRRDGWNSDENFKDTPQQNDDGTYDCTTTMHVIAISGESPMVKKIDKAVGEEIYGYTQCECTYKYILVVTDRALSPEIVQQTSTHEMGHMLMQEHVPVPYRSIMYPGDLYAARCVTDLDIFQLCNDPFFGCDPKTMNPCDPGVPAWEKR